MPRKAAAAEAPSQHKLRGSSQFAAQVVLSPMNYFEVFGLPKLLNIDLGTLEKQFHELSRKHHPDYFTAGSADEKQQSLQMTALLNDAYRTLRHPLRRVEYLLKLEGYKPDGSKVPQS